MRIGEAWGRFRGEIRDAFTFYEIKDLAGAAGVPSAKIAPLQQQQNVTKGQLLDTIEMAAGSMPADAQDRVTAEFLRAAARRKPSVINMLIECLAPVGWGVDQSGELYSHDLHLGPDASQLPAQVRDLIDQAVRRFAAGDYARGHDIRVWCGRSRNGRDVRRAHPG